MSLCKNIDGLVLDTDSRRALDLIYKKKALYKALRVSLVGGTLADILSGRTPAARHLSIKLTDFQALHSALSGVNDMFLNQLLRIATMQVAERAGNSKNKTFWENIYYGCKY